MKLLTPLSTCLFLSEWLCNNDDSMMVTAFSPPHEFREVSYSRTKLSSFVENSESQKLFIDATTTSLGPNRNRIMTTTTTPSPNRYRYSNAILMEDDDDKTTFSSSNNISRQKESDWKEKLTKLSNIASILCVLDCTILPIVSIALPLLGGGLSLLDTSTSVVAGTCSTGVMESISHSVALYFVLPLGILTTVLNQITMKPSQKMSNFFVSKIVPKLPFLGLSLIYLSNAPSSQLDLVLSSQLVHALHCGTTLHRVVNLSGCAILLGSNYYMKKDQQCSFRGSSIDSSSLLCTLGCCLPQDKSSSQEQSQAATFFTWKQ